MRGRSYHSPARSSGLSPVAAPPAAPLGDRWQELQTGLPCAFLHEYIVLFLDSSASYVAALQAELHHADLQGLAFTADALYGSSALLGATSLAALSRSLERYSQANNVAAARLTVHQIIAEMGRVDLALR